MHGYKQQIQVIQHREFGRNKNALHCPYCVQYERSLERYSTVLHVGIEHVHIDQDAYPYCVILKYDDNN